VDYIERNTVWGFNERVRRNFNVVNSAWENGSSDAHVVTQLILSLLGLIVFPCAEVKERGDKSLQVTSSIVWLLRDGPNGNSRLATPTT
jgi:hypothetical protein